MDTGDFKSTALRAAERASAVLQGYFGKRRGVQVKTNQSLVSAADLESNKVIISEILKDFPEHGILSEEGGKGSNDSDYRWIIDPLDGTHNFLHQIPILGTSIALEYRNQIIVGVMKFPFLSLTAVAEKGKGSFLNGKRMRVSKTSKTDHSMILFEFPYSRRSEEVRIIEKLAGISIDLRDFGSAIYHLLLVAKGSGDAYITITTNEWDLAAGCLCVLEAGGKMTDLSGKKCYVDNKSNLISNNALHGKILDLIRRMRISKSNLFNEHLMT